MTFVFEHFEKLFLIALRFLAHTLFQKAFSEKLQNWLADNGYHKTEPKGDPLFGEGVESVRDSNPHDLALPSF